MCQLCLNVGNVDFLYENQKRLKSEDVAILREWMKKESHLPKINDYQIAMFLHSCYYNIESTKKCIENYYTLRTHCPEFFANRNLDSESLRIHFKTVIAIPLPKLTPENYLVCYVKLHNCKTETYNFNDGIKIIDMCITLCNQQIGPKEGHILIMDGNGLQLGHVLKMNLMSMKKYFVFVQEAMPVRLKQIHVLNVNPIVEKFLNLVRPCLKKELQEQMYCHAKMDSLYKFVPKNMLPNDYGGDAGFLDELHKRQMENVKEHLTLLNEDEYYRSDESKRVGKRSNLEEFFGIEGTFKKLDID